MYPNPRGFPVYLSVTTLAELTAPIWLKKLEIESAVELYERPPMKRVGVSMTAFPWGASPPKAGLLLNPPLWLLPPLLKFFFWDSSMVRDLPRCSLPLSSIALLNEDFLENLTKAVPLDLPSSLVKSLTSVTFPHSLKKSLISLS